MWSCLVAGKMDKPGDVMKAAEDEQGVSLLASLIRDPLYYAPLFSGLMVATLSMQLLNLACAAFNWPNDEVRCCTSVSSCFLTSRS